MLYRLIKKILVLSLAGFSIYGLQRFCHNKTDGFSVSKIRVTSSFSTQAVQERDKVLSILSQPLSYIGRGGQCYAFSTEDGNHVVKLLKYNNNYPKIWFRLFPFPFGLEKYRQEKIAHKKKKLQGEYNSYKIARDHLKEETGIVYFHLNRGEIENTPIKIKDRLGIVHTLDADKYEFYIQKKGTPFYPGLKKLIDEGRIDAAKEVIKELAAFLLTRCKQKITDGDDGIWRNFAFHEGHPFQIDIGQFSYKDSLISKKDYTRDLIFFTKDFKNWLETISPELSEYLSTSLSADAL
jgi:hypothetical protein